MIKLLFYIDLFIIFTALGLQFRFIKQQDTLFKSKIKMEIQPKYDVVIIGGGVYGLSIAYYLSRKEDIKIALLQQYTIGNNKGSSHSSTRITRTLYEKQVYQQLSLECLTKNWPEIEKVLGEKIVYDSEFVYFDDDEQTYNSYKKVAQKRQPKETIQICTNFEECMHYFSGRKFPLINSKYPPIIDKKAGVIFASLYIKKLKEFIQKNCQNVALMEHTFVKSIYENKNEITLETATQIISADKVVIASGKSIGQIVPEVQDLFTVVKQFAAFLEVEQESEFTVGQYPSFLHNKNGKSFYSVPVDTYQKIGLKLAEHRLNQPLNPIQNSIDYNYEQLRKKALQYFGDDLVRVKNVQECIYTMTKSNDFVIDWIGESERMLICSCCSGHGFKFAPFIGEMISDMLTSDEKQQGNQSKKSQTKNKTFEKWQHMFKIPYHRGINLRQ